MKLKVIYRRTRVDFQTVEIYGKDQAEIVEKSNLELHKERLQEGNWTPDMEKIEPWGIEP